MTVMSMPETESPLIGYPFLVEQVTRSGGETRWEAEVLDLPGCVAVADTIDALVSEVAYAIEDWIEVAKSRGMPIPESSSRREYSGKITVRMAPDTHRRVTLLAKSLGVSLNSYITGSLELRAGKESAGQTQIQHAYFDLAGLLTSSDSSVPVSPNRVAPFLMTGSRAVRK
jgi:predicted HicB family RNase H-like nuclease